MTTATQTTTQTPQTGIILPAAVATPAARKKNYRGEAYTDAKGHDPLGNIYFNPETKKYIICDGEYGTITKVYEREYEGREFTKLAEVRLSAAQTLKRFQVAI